MSHRSPVVKYGILIVLASFGGCKEQLPPYEDPRDILEGQSRGEYVLSISDNSMNVYFIVKNRYDESLQAKAVLKGNLHITLLRNPQVTKTVALRDSNLIQSRNYIPQTGEIILDPGDSIRLLYKWNWVSDQGTDLRTQVFEYLEDTTCTLRCLAKEETFVISGEIKVFEAIATVKIHPVYFNVRFVSNFVLLRDCPPILPYLPPTYGKSTCLPIF